MSDRRVPTAAWAGPGDAGDDDPVLGHGEARESGALPGIWQVAVSRGAVGALLWTVSDGRARWARLCLRTYGDRPACMI